MNHRGILPPQATRRAALCAGTHAGRARLHSSLGDAEQVQLTQIAGSAASIGISAATMSHLIAGTAAGPIGLAVAGLVLALSAIFSRKGPQQKVASTHIVDDLEAEYLKPNLAQYQAGPHTRAAQQEALAKFDVTWAYLTGSQGCGNPQLGAPGAACIKDRARGGQWDWFAMYRDPIANDPNVHDDAAQDAVMSVFPGADPSFVSTLIKFAVVAAIGAALLME